MTHFTATTDMEMRVLLELQAFIIRYIFNVLYFSLHFHELYYSFLKSFEHRFQSERLPCYTASDLQKYENMITEQN
jgi:hypothetical protein